MIMAADICGFLYAMHDRAKAFERLCELAGPEQAEIMREERRKEEAEEKAHRRALEIAEAGRPRNFWGQ